MLESCSNIETLYFDMEKTERVEDEYFTEEFRTKLQYSPYYIYSKKIEDGKTPELLFRKGDNDDKALINPDGFPWFNISLDPMGDLMRKNQHHTLYESGYRYALSILQHLFDKYGDEVIQMASRKNDTLVRGAECYLLEFDNSHFTYINYKVGKDETVLDIAEKYMLSEFMIVEINEEIDDFDDVEEGQVILITNDYCKRLRIAIEKDRLIPLSMKVFDDKGLYEQLEYSNVEVNPVFKPEEFTEEQEGYGF